MFHFSDPVLGLVQAVGSSCSSQTPPAEDGLSHHTEFHQNIKRPEGDREVKRKESRTSKKLQRSPPTLLAVAQIATHSCERIGLSPICLLGENYRALGGLLGEDVLVTAKGTALALLR